VISATSEGFIDNAEVKDLAAGDYVRLSIADTGVGMNDEILAKAREPFFTTKGPGKGTGLGLSMVHGLAIQSGGALRLSSTPGKGTTVDLWLPISKADEKSREPMEERPFCQSTGQRWRVLLVDDDALIRMGTADMLEDLGHEVIEAKSGTEALSVLQATAGIDVVITDQAMPGMRGTDLAAHIGQLQPSLPVILATGYAELPNSEACALPQLAKPYRQQEVAAMLEAVLRTDRDAAAKSLDRTRSNHAIG
jgi:CheY-like chemotaxis protein